MKTLKKSSKFYFLLSFVFLFCFISFVFIHPVHADDGELKSEDGNFLYRVENGDTITLTKYVGPKGIALKIPETIDGKEVTTIGTNFLKGAAYDYDPIGTREQKNIPSSIFVPKTVTLIQTDAISGFSGKLTISSSGKPMTIEYCAFFHNYFKSVTIPKRVTKIGTCAFGYYTVCEDIEGIDKYEDEIHRLALKEKNFSVYGTKGSAAEKYAKKHGFLFNKKNINLCTLKLSNKKHFYYYGKKVYQTYTLYDGTKKVAINKVYKNNSKIGVANVTITSKDKAYGGTIKDSYDIEPAPTKITKLKGNKRSFTITTKKCAGNVKYQIMYNVERPGWNAPHAYWHYRYTTKLTKTIPVDVKGKYHVKVRAVAPYKEYNEEKGQIDTYNMYGPWTTLKTVTVK